MRHFINILTETRRGLAPIGEMRAKVFWQPLHSDLINMLAKSKIGDIRGSRLETPEGVLIAIWPARNLGHWNFHNECYQREGIQAESRIDLRICRDLDTLQEEKYWSKSRIYAGEGFYCASAASHALTDGELTDYPDLMKLFGAITPLT